MNISVVIPTYNRAEILKQCLECLAGQTYDKGEFEVIVVDDGSGDGTGDVVKSFDGGEMKLSYLWQENSGQGVARNRGIEKAEGEVVMFIGDDILLNKYCLEMHWNRHLKFGDENVGVLGFIDWHASLEVTPFMKWLTDGSSVLGKFGGHQFAFEKLEGKEWADFNFFYTSNISLKRSLLVKHKFDESFRNYGWEDIELGYRLTKEEKFRLAYEPRAIGYHLHQMDESSLAGRMEMIGRSAHVIHAKYPELGKMPSLKKRLVFWVLGSWPSIWFWKGLAVVWPRFGALYFYALSKRYFMRGVNSAR